MCINCIIFGAAMCSRKMLCIVMYDLLLQSKLFVLLQLYMLCAVKLHPDMTFAIDWALKKQKNKYLSICLAVKLLWIMLYV